MAEELFGQRAKGKPAGKKDFWTDARFSDLGARRASRGHPSHASNN
jgi:hypothetical protein